VASKRLARLNEQLKREIAHLVRTGVRDPRVGVVTITGVEVARDLGSARVYVRTLGEEPERAEALVALNAAGPFLRRTLGQTLHIRRIPELRFQEDRSLEQALRIERILSDVIPDELPEEAPEDDESE
jgi:ribosome-binding factor A